MIITGLTRQQVQLLDTMWSIKDIEEYDQWKAGLCENTMNTVDTLEQLVYWAQLDDVVDVGDAEVLLRRYR